jgi:type I restriction-modification system DNA methylase subunit
VYSDGPIGTYVSEFANMIHGDGKKYKSDYFNVKLALNSLSEKGRAFVAIPGNVLFSVNKNYLLLREEILPYLKSVIALPPMWVRANVPTFVLVLEKGMTDNNVIFMDASNRGTLQRNRIYTLDNNAMGDILKAYNGQQIEGFSSIVDKTYIKTVEDLVLTPNHYIKKDVVVNYRPVAVINNELATLYDELKRIIEE